MIYFTADMHFGHKAIITMQNRPFESVEEMDRVLLQNYNAVVHKDDTVYILGDICHHIKIEQADELISRYEEKHRREEAVECDPASPAPDIVLKDRAKDFFEMTVDDFEIRNYEPIKPQLTFELGI